MLKRTFKNYVVKKGFSLIYVVFERPLTNSMIQKIFSQKLHELWIINRKKDFKFFHAFAQNEFDISILKVLFFALHLKMTWILLT